MEWLFNRVCDVSDSVGSFLHHNNPKEFARRREAAIKASQIAKAAAERAARAAKFWGPVVTTAKYVGVAGAAFGGAAAAVYVIHKGHQAIVKARLNALRSELDGRDGVAGRLDQAGDMPVVVRDCLPGEAHDFVDYEPAQEVHVGSGGDLGTDGDDGETAAPTGAVQRRGPALRRKKYHYSPHATHGRCGPYISHVIAEARLRYNGRPANSSNEDAARDFMVRMMREHGMTATDIDREIVKMVTAVFWQRKEDVEELGLRKKARACGRYGCDSVE
jgi:hypothetical protein